LVLEAFDSNIIEERFELRRAGFEPERLCVTSSEAPSRNESTKLGKVTAPNR
jgi:hypothetical protein